MTLHRDYDSNFRVIGETAQGLPLFFGYDVDGMLQCVNNAPTAGCAGGLGIARTPGSTLLSSTTFPVAGAAPIVEGYKPNGFGETLHYQAVAGAETVYAVDYTRDGIGRIASKSEALLNADATTSFRSFTYTYDAAWRLTDVVADDGTHAHYDFDANGNRLRRSVAGPGGATEELATYGVGDQLLTYAGRAYHYTASGVLHDVVDANGTTTYTYDALGNLRTVVLPDNTRIDYVIDGRNRRVGKLIGGQLIKGWLYEDALRIAGEVNFDGHGNVTGVKRFGYGSKGNVPDLMVMQDGTRYRILSDYLGSPRIAIAEQGDTVALRMDFDEFGRVLTNTQPGLLPFGFAGGLYDPDTGLVRFGTRDYDPEAGRWAAKDSSRFGFSFLADRSGWNVYAYAGNDPVNEVDPFGYAPQGAGGAPTSDPGTEGSSTCSIPRPPRPNPGAPGDPGPPGSDPRKDFCFWLALGVYGVCLSIDDTTEPECLQAAARLWLRCTNTKKI
jgi:RHS repeat-associated protein